jgi:hypothetical protein
MYVAFNKWTRSRNRFQNSYWKQEHAAPTNKKQENWGCLDSKKENIKILFSERGASKKEPAPNLNYNLTMLVNKVPIHIVTQSV